MQFIDPTVDPWKPAAAQDLHAPETGLLWTLEQWQTLAKSCPDGLRAGVILSNDADIDRDLPQVHRLSLVVLNFPKWTDGRAYSQARLLRSRARFAGEIRAVGDVLADMLPQLSRTGFDAVQLRADQRQEHAQRALAFFDQHYQGDVHEPRPIFRRDIAAIL